MITHIHPSIGYLSTRFTLYVKSGSPLKYSAEMLETTYNNGETLQAIRGEVRPLLPTTIKLPFPGKWKITFENGEKHEVFVEDGYKFGGSKLKNCFVFDNCPWTFVIMHDRTYFSNRDTGEEYVEAISPDEVKVISTEYVLFKNYGQDEISLYSLSDQKPVLWLTNLAHYDESSLVWEESDNAAEEKILYIFSIKDMAIRHRVKNSEFIIDNTEHKILYAVGKTIRTVELTGNFDIISECSCKGSFLTFISAEKVAWSYLSHGKHHLVIASSQDASVLKDIEMEGVIAEINAESFINSRQRWQAIRTLDLDEAGLPDVVIAAKYNRFFFYDCGWDVFYVQNEVSIERVGSACSYKEETHLLSFNSPIKIRLENFDKGEFLATDSFLLYYYDGGKESVVRGRVYSGSGYVADGKIYRHNNDVFLERKGDISMLSRNGYWDPWKKRKEGEYDFKLYSDYGVLKNESIGNYITPAGLDLGRYRKAVNEVAIFDNWGVIRGGGELLSVDEAMSVVRCSYLSESLKWGIVKDDNGFSLVKFGGIEAEEVGMLECLYDSKEYGHALLSEDGSEIMYRTEKETCILDVESGEIQSSYPAMSYIRHINGIRASFERAGALQPRLINPVTGQYLNHKEMAVSHFSSPDNKYYADSRLSDYIEYYFRDTREKITKEEYSQLRSRLSFAFVEKGSAERERIRNARKRLIEEHCDCISELNPDCFNGDNRGVSQIIEDEKNTVEGVDGFLNRLIGKRGIAVIRKVSDDSIYAKINLGAPLTFMNYVAFSYDSKYVAIAGYRDGGGGCFLLFDLDRLEIVIERTTARAVWTAAFSPQGTVATYTSDPTTFLAKKSDECEGAKEVLNRIEGYNFLVYSPDGRYFALSNQGYVGKYDQNGKEVKGWGHKPSTLVEVRATDDFSASLIKFEDLSETGIDEGPRCRGSLTNARKSTVAAVSFSRDNRRLMMVGNDGVVIIRNLHLKDHAC